MRRNYTYNAVVPSSRNDFIDHVQTGAEAIIISNVLLHELEKELNANKMKGKAKTALKTAGIAGLLLCNLFNPLTWILGVGSILAGGLIKNDIKNYSAYRGEDTSDHEIIVLIHKKKVNLKFDTVNYPSFVKNIDCKKTNGQSNAK